MTGTRSASLRVSSSSLGASSAAPVANGLDDRGVLGGELVQAAAAQQVDARVAEVPERDPRAAGERGDHGRAHAGRARIRLGALVDAPVGLLDGGAQPLLGALVP